MREVLLSPFLLGESRVRHCYVTCPVSHTKSVSELGAEMRSGDPFNTWIKGSCFLLLATKNLWSESRIEAIELSGSEVSVFPWKPSSSNSWVFASRETFLIMVRAVRELYCAKRCSCAAAFWSSLILQPGSIQTCSKQSSCNSACSLIFFAVVMPES